MKQNKTTPPERSYEEMMEDFYKATTAKEYRVIHKELKHSRYHSGVPIFLRYPLLPDVFSIGALIFAAIILTVKCKTG